MTDNAIYSKFSVYLSDIDNVDKYSQKIKLAENLFYFLTGDEEAINLLKSNDRFFNICFIKHMQVFKGKPKKPLDFG